jgi:DNA-binding GntR family transcriptional regulator
VPSSLTNPNRSDPRSASQVVADGVLRALEEGRLSPGQRLVEADVAIRFGVGRNAVREGLQRLAADGVVEMSRNKGAIIRELSAEQALMTLELTERLIGLAARSAARGIGAPGAASVVEHALERLASAVAVDDLRAFLRARNGLFGALLTASGNHELQRVSPTVQLHVLRAQYHLSSAYRRLHGDLTAIGKAVLAGDAEEAEDQARAHVRRVREALQRELDE